MMSVLQTLLASRFKDDTIVVFSPTMATSSVRITECTKSGTRPTRRRYMSP